MKRTNDDPRIATKVIEMVAAHYKTTPAVLRTNEGDSKARRVLMYILKKELGTSLGTALRAVNKKYASEVYTAIKKIEPLLKTDTDLATMIEEVKTEVLMLSTMSGEPSLPAVQSIPLRQSMSASGKPLQVASQTETTAPATIGKNKTQIIGNVQKAVTNVFLGESLFQSENPEQDVSLAKDAILFLLWKDLEQPMVDLMSFFRVKDENDFFRVIGRMVVYSENDSDIKKKLKAARTAYSQT